MPQPTPRDTQTFYGQPLPHPKLLPTLSGEVRHGVKHNQPYSYLAYLDEQGVKWQIEPVADETGQVTHLQLHQRNRAGQTGFHAQCFRTENTATGLRAMVQYIKQAEMLTDE